MPTYVEIAVNVPQVTSVFHYHLPEELEGQVLPGHLVTVPFRKQTVYGVVLRQVDTPEVPETRPVLELVDPAAVLTAQQIRLAETLAEANLTPLAACIGLMLPPGLMQQADAIYTLTEFGQQIARQSSAGLTAGQARLLALLDKRGALRGQQIDRALPRVNWQAAVRPLTRQGIISTEAVLPSPRVRPKIVRTARLACPPEVALLKMDTLSRAGSQALARRQAILRFLLIDHGPVNVTWLYAESGGNLQDLYSLEQAGLVALGETEDLRDPLAQFEFQLSEPPELTQDQERVWSAVRDQMLRDPKGASPRPFLLHGVTGSGKTEIYLRAVRQALDSGRQAIVLVPEIALTPQTIRRFADRFPGQAGMLHSGLSEGERYDSWRRARQGELGLIVGPRSALFTPFPDLGLIIVDECHDDTYYQSDSMPSYDARRAAVAYARLAGAVCILGSATPDITQMHLASRGEWHYLHLPARILAHHQAVQAQLERLKLKTGRPERVVTRFQPLEAQADSSDLPRVQVVDMRQELKEGNRSIFSRALHSALEQVLAEEQQAILFLNRRGSATYIFCRDCGYSLRCPRCDIPLTYHMEDPQKADSLKCHYCGYQRGVPKACPNCQGSHIRHFGIGTERVETEIKNLFPEARVLRWDSETARKKGAHEVILSHFLAHRADVLVGTQMLAKGLDLPLVTLVGAVLADVGLNLPDYHAAERTFQVLTQVAGRAGRSLLGGQVVLQTFQPEHYVIQAASRHDYKGFYQRELDLRRQMGYPPFANLVRLEYRHTNLKEAERQALEMAARLRSWIAADGHRNTYLIGPVPCFFSRLSGQYRWQIVLRGPDPVSILRSKTLGEWRVEVNPPNLL